MGCFVPPEFVPDGPATAVAGGEIRWARDLTGRRVRLRWYEAGDQRVRDRLCEVVGTLGSFRHPGLAEPVLALLVDDGLIIVEAAERDLTGGSVTADELPGATARLADALASMHRHGVAAGSFGPADLVCTQTGEWQFSGFGMAAAAEGRRVDARDGGAELAAFLTGLPGIPESVRATLSRLSLRRPAPAEVAAALALAEPGRGVPAPARKLAARPVARRGHRHRARSLRPVAAVGAGLLALLVAVHVVSGLRFGLAAAHPADTGWAAVLSSLDTTRSSALAAPRATSLAGAEVVGSPVWTRDTAILRALAASGERAVGLTEVVISAVKVGGWPGAVELRVVESLPPYRLLTAAGSVIAEEPGHGPRSYLFRLGLTRSGWRVYSVSG